MHTLNNEQQQVKATIQAMKGDDRLIVSGRAGSGKTYAISNSVVERKALFLAATHPACAVLSQELNETPHTITTIHKAIGSKKRRNEKLVNVDWYLPAKKAKQRQEQAGEGDVGWFGDVEIIIVDEFSLVGSFLFKAIEEYATEFGLPVVYSGDRFQLPPVKDHEVIMDQGFKTITLDNSIRFPRVSEIFQLGEMLRGLIEAGSTGKVPFIEGGAEVQVVSGAEWIAGLSQGYQKGDSLLAVAADNKTIKRLRSKIRTVDNDDLVQGDIVASRQTDDVFRNGEQFTIESIIGDMRILDNVPSCLSKFKTLSIDGFAITFSETGRTAFVPKDDYQTKKLAERARHFFTENRINKAQASRVLDWIEEVNSFELISIATVHKSQGRSVDTVYIDTDTVLKRPFWLSPQNHMRLLYTAITRARKRVVFYKMDGLCGQSQSNVVSISQTKLSEVSGQEQAAA